MPGPFLNPHLSRLFFCFFLVLALIPANGVGAQPPERPLNLDFVLSSTTPHQGLTYHHYQSTGTDHLDAISAFVLEVELDAFEVKYVLALDQILGQEPPTSMVDRLGAVGGINGGFSVTNDPWQIFHGDPNGFFVIDGAVISEPVEPRATFGLCKDEAGKQTHHIFRPRVWAYISNGHDNHNVGLNRSRGDNDLVAYTPHWGRNTITNQDGIEITVWQQVVRGSSSSGSNIIPGDGFVLSATGNKRALLESFLPGDTLALELFVEDLDAPGTFPSMAGCSYSSAGPELVRAGNPILTYEREEFGDHFTFIRHPRTAIGVDSTEQKLLVIVVDGRQPEHSVGMTLPELARFMVDINVHEGYNLDGGGSSILVLDDEIKNLPSDGRERRRSDGIVFIPKKPPTRP